MSFRAAFPGIAMGPVRVNSSSPVWVTFGPCRYKSVVSEARWSTASTAGTLVTVTGGISSGSTDRGTLVLLKSTAKGQKTSTGTATKVAYRLKLTPTGTFTAAKYADVWFTAMLATT